MTEVPEAIVAAVVAVVGFELDPGSSPETSLSDLGLDSLSVIQVMIAIEDEVAVDASSLELPDLVTLGDLIAHRELLLERQRTD